jgi:glucose/mannose-6-phosphate isomerase
MQNKIDKENLYEVIKNIPNQLIKGLEIARNVKVEGKFKAVEISGMGGSALPGNLLRIYLHDLFHKDPERNHRFGIYQNRFYSLPPEAFDNCLNIISSYSGNTEETISSFKEALKNNLPCVGIASGGKVIEMCKNNNISFVLMPPKEKLLEPRMATACNFAAVFQILVNLGMMEDKTKEFQAYADQLKQNGKEMEEAGKSIAIQLKGKTPVIYSSTKFKSLAMIWKIMINENAKTPAIWNFFPELDHNEVNGYVLPQGKFHVVMLCDKNDHLQNIKRFNITADIIKEYGTGTTIIDIPGGDMLYRIFATLQIGCWASYYLALEYGIDPTPIEIVEKFKMLLTK